MTKQLAITLILLMCGCTSIKMAHDSFSDLHFVSTAKRGEYAVIFMDMASALPVYDWRLRIRQEGPTNIYQLTIYSDLRNKTPLPSIMTDGTTGYTTIMLEMPEFRSGRDQLVLMDSEGVYPVSFKESSRTHTQPNQ
jgi:hypothetical protein